MFKKLFQKKEKSETKAMVGVGSGEVSSPPPKQQQQSSSSTAPASAPRRVVNKKGEVNELIALFNKSETMKSIESLRDVLSKTISVMTMGFDVSPLFTYVVNAAVNKDMIVKKMSYLYLVSCAKHNEEVSILAINTFLKDCSNEDPKIRGLAIRSLTSLRVPSVVEYMMKPIGECIQDRSPYVRRCAVMGLLKAYHIDNDVVVESGLLQNLGNLLQDPDAQVCVDAIRVLLELGVEFDVDALVVHPLLNRLGEFNEWCLCAVLDLISRYHPESEEEVFNIMNLLEPALRQHNTAVVMSTMNCYLKFTRDLPEVTAQVYFRMKQPMLTLMANPSFEISYCILAHLRLMLQRDPSAYQDEYRQFYVRYNEPASIQQMKIQILPLLANEYNFSDICQELVEYVIGTTESVSREAVRAIAHVATVIPESSDIVQETLMEFLDVDIEHIRSETMCVFQDLLRKYPNMCHDIVPIVPFMLKKTEDSKGRSACLWILGAFPTLADEAPYVVESIINEYEWIESIDIKMSLLTCAMKLFFARPPEMQRMLGDLLGQALEDKKSPDLTDRATLYYHLLEYDLDTAKTIISGSDISVSNFNDKDPSLEQTLFDEFNTLAVVYHKPSSHFLADKDLFVPELTYEEEEDNEDDEQEEDGSDQNFMGGAPGGAEFANGVEDLMGMTSSAMMQEEPEATGDSLELVSAQPLDPPSFQKMWTSLPVAQTLQSTVGQVDVGAIGSAMGASGLSLMASGDKGAVLQFFFYGQDSSSSYYLILMMVQKASGSCSAQIKSNSGTPELIESFVEYTQGVLSTL